MPATPSANTIGIDSRISATKTMATVASSMNDPPSVLRRVLWQRRDHHRKPVSRDQDAADHRGCVEPGEIDFEAGRGQRAVEQAEFQAVPRGEQADAGDQRVVETMDPELRRLRQSMHEHGKGEMRARVDADRCANQGQPRQREFAHLLDPGERHRVDVEPVGDGADEIAQDHADQQVDDGKDDQRRDREFWDGWENPQHARWNSGGRGGRTAGPKTLASARLCELQALKLSISSHTAPYWLL